MKVLQRIKSAVLRFWHSQIPKYIIVCIVGVLVVGFFGENSVLSHIRYRQQISELEEEKAKFEADFQRDQNQIRELSRNPKAIERIARERYFMKADDEDIFMLSDDNRIQQPVVPHATVN